MAYGNPQLDFMLGFPYMYMYIFIHTVQFPNQIWESIVDCWYLSIASYLWLGAIETSQCITNRINPFIKRRFALKTKFREALNWRINKSHVSLLERINTSRAEHNGRYFADDSWNALAWINVIVFWFNSLKFASSSPNKNNKYRKVLPEAMKTNYIGDFTGIDSAYRPDPTIGSGLTPDNKGTRFLCLVLTNRSPRKLEARG